MKFVTHNWYIISRGGMEEVEGEWYGRSGKQDCCGHT